MIGNQYWDKLDTSEVKASLPFARDSHAGKLACMLVGAAMHASLNSPPVIRDSHAGKIALLFIRTAMQTSIPLLTGDSQAGKCPVSWFISNF